MSKFISAAWEHNTHTLSWLVSHDNHGGAKWQQVEATHVFASLGESLYAVVQVGEAGESHQ